MPYTINTAKAKIRGADGHYHYIDVFSDDLKEALEAIGRNNNQGARGAAVTAVQTIADNINTSTANQLTDASAVANMVAQQFNVANTYKSGDYVRYTTTSNNTTINKLYKLTADHAANVTWENTSKTEVTLSNDVVDLKSAFSHETTYNLFDANNLHVGINIAIGSGVATVENNSSFVAYCLEIEPNTVYRIDKKNVSSRFVYALFEHEPEIGDTSTKYANISDKTSYIVSVPQNYTYILLVVANINRDNLDIAIENLMIKVNGASAPYKKNAENVLKPKNLGNAIEIAYERSNVMSRGGNILRYIKKTSTYQLGWRPGSFNSDGSRNGWAGYVRTIKSFYVDEYIIGMKILPPQGYNVRIVVTNADIYSDNVTVYDYQISTDSAPVYIQNVAGRYVAISFSEVQAGYDDVDGEQVYREAYERNILNDLIILLEYSDGLITPEYYGAVGDGITDDSDAIQAAINNYSTVMLRGIYLIKKPILIDKSNVNLIGENAKIIASSVLEDKMLIIASSSETKNIHINGIEFDGGSHSQGRRINDIYDYACIYGMPNANAIIHDVYITDCYIHSNGKAGDGIYFGDNHNGGHADTGDIPYNNETGADFVYNIVIKDCIIEDVCDGVKNSHISVTIDGCTIRRCQNESVTLDWACRRCAITNNHIGPHYGGAGSIATDGAREIIISNNVFDEEGYHWVRSNRTATRTGITFNGHTDEARDYLVANNIFRGCAGPCVSIGANSDTEQERPLINGVINNNIFSQADGYTDCPSVYVWQHSGNGEIILYGNTYTNSTSKVGYSESNGASIECLRLYLNEASIVPVPFDTPVDD